ncbi:hypothetical protein [Paenibacillus sp. GCM10027626]|uniref:hypothetical protein n=1 Tax=Paenibacillus sp. GCM10027626 TaxID=3273411 RepID=UPI0036278C80
MKAIIHIIMLFFLTSSTPMNAKPVHLELPKSKNKLGIGLIHFNLNTPIPLYKSESDLAPYDTLRFVRIESGKDKGKCDFQTDKLGKHLRPYTMNEGDSDKEAKEHINMGLIRFSPELTFRVLSKTDDGFTVMINEETLETSFVKVDLKNDLRKNTSSDPDFFDPNFVDSKIADWFYYETWGQALKRAWYITYDENEVYNQPEGTKITPSVEFNRADSVEGDWVRLRERYNDNKNDFGWVKWRENDSLKIGIVLNGGYE